MDNAARYNANIPHNVFACYQPISYDKYLAVAPGVVLIRAAGHTPGSQLIYVRTAKGQEILFIGDVAWHMRNIELVRERARLVTMFMLREDTDAVLAQLKALKSLDGDEPKILIVPGHDQGVVNGDVAAGIMQTTFR
jgi:glyoxylase-like metal-dependent hydrolase (beta-lactamase superfamily II)